MPLTERLSFGLTVNSCRLCVSAWLVCVTIASAAGGERNSFLHNGVTAHRGDSGRHPENTLPALQSGIEAGADWIELDIFRTRDGRLVVIHDRTTARVGDRELDVTESTYAELAVIDVANEFRRRTGATHAECPPQSVPLLADVLRLVKGQHRTRVSIQPKMDCVADAVALVKELQAEPWVGFNDGNLAYMAEVKRLAPELTVFWDRPAHANVEADIRTARDLGFEGLVLHKDGVTGEKVRQIRNAGLEAGAWTVNDPGEMRTLLGAGVQRLYTDHPRTLLALKDASRELEPVQCEGLYAHHLQGVCLDDEAIYWSFTTQLVKTDRQGKVLKQIPVANHHGDLCHRDGKLYVAVNLGKFNDPQGNADSWVYEYAAGDLSLLAKHPAPEVFHGAGGIDSYDGHYFVVGGLPAEIEENYVYEYDESFAFVKKHVVKSGQTRLGIQTAAFADGRWWFGCYGNPAVLLVTDASFQMQGRHEFNASLGIIGLGDGRFLVAGGRCEKGKGCSGHLRPAVADEKNGLRFVK